MQPERIKAKPMNNKEIALCYGISLHILKQWLTPIKKELGKQVGRMWNVNQVKFMFNHWGEPGDE